MVPVDLKISSAALALDYVHRPALIQGRMVAHCNHHLNGCGHLRGAHDLICTLDEHLRASGEAYTCLREELTHLGGPISLNALAWPIGSAPISPWADNDDEEDSDGPPPLEYTTGPGKPVAYFPELASIQTTANGIVAAAAKKGDDKQETKNDDQRDHAQEAKDDDSATEETDYASSEGESVERAWVEGITAEYPPYVTTVGGYHHPLGPCPLPSHTYFDAREMKAGVRCSMREEEVEVQASDFIQFTSATLLVCSRSPMAFFNASGPRRCGRNSDSAIHYETGVKDLASDQGIYPSQDGLRTIKRAVNIGLRRRRIKPSDLEDPYGKWDPIPKGDEAGPGIEEEEEEEGVPMTGGRGSDDPNILWRRLQQLFLDEILRDKVRKEWAGGCWKDVTLKSLDLVYQPGHGCDLADTNNNLSQLLRNWWYPASTVDPATCATFQALELYRVLNVMGNINARDFVGSLKHLTDATARSGQAKGTTWQASGLQKTGCAPFCVGCPQEGINLPIGWQEAAPEFRFLYMLILAIDANFQLKNRLRKNEHDDPSFGSGWGHLVEENLYRLHLVDYAAEKDISTCIAFAALLQKDTRMMTGLRCSGVGGVACTWHELVRPQGVGDLQKGERYSNMDYIALCSILGLTLLWLTFSYDIACQWQINFKKRMEKLPEALRISEEVQIQFGLPVCQLPITKLAGYLEGVGWTDGEGIERTWSGLNPATWATKEMGKGARHDALEDRIDHHNWEKNINEGDTLARKLVVAIAERDHQVDAFIQVDASLKSEVRRDWQKHIDEWPADRTKPNPYEIEGGRRSSPSEAAVQLDLKKDKLRETAEEEGATVHRKGTTALLVAGMQLEELQGRIKAEAKGRALLAADQEGHVTELQMSLLGKLQTFRALQARHMTAAVAVMEKEEEERDGEEVPGNPEEVKLWMPSQLTARQRVWGCVKGLGDREGKLREAQCSNALDVLRSWLHAKRHMITSRNSQIVGQKQATCSFTLIGQIGERIEATATKYRRARAALIVLFGEDFCEALGLRELTVADVMLDVEQKADTGVRYRLGKIGSNRHCHRNEPSVSSKKKMFSWIWTASGGPDSDEGGLHDSVRVEWSKAKACKDRWIEEVQLLREEMRRVMCFLCWKAVWWENQRVARGMEVHITLQAGLKAYAARQAALHRGIARRFKTGWDTLRAVVVRTAAVEDALLAENMTSFSAAADEASGSGNEGVVWPELGEGLET
ncbi:hypothetical protein DFH09DRAFT_1084132 [Mycena vulgaris]|nr:hypothetical protein DFH09DRAFT_1084132 [Mycena vulgaris]